MWNRLRTPISHGTPAGGRRTASGRGDWLGRDCWLGRDGWLGRHRGPVALVALIVVVAALTGAGVEIVGTNALLSGTASVPANTFGTGTWGDSASAGLVQIGHTGGCTSDDGTSGTCLDGTALGGATGGAVSPDGKNVYVASVTADALTAFTRNTTTGVLSQISGTGGCVSETGTGGLCVDGTALDGVGNVVVSPDNAHVYAVSNASDAVVAFTRNTTTGVLTQLSGTGACVAEVVTGATASCFDGYGVDGARGIAIDPTGAHVYVSSDVSDAVTAFTRNSTTGVLTQVSGTTGCVSEAGIGGSCADGVALDGAGNVAVSPDGANVYVASFTSNAVAAFTRNTSTGALTQLATTGACVSEVASGATAQCTDGRSLTGPRSVVVSPDNKHIYVAAESSDAVAMLVRNTSTGVLTGANACVSDAALAGCTNVALPLDGASSVTVSPDGAQVYVASNVSNAVTVFTRDTTTGIMTPLTGVSACYAELPGTPATTTGCTDGKGLTGASGVFAAPDGAQIYAASSTSAAVLGFTRDTSTGGLLQQGSNDGCISDDGTLGTCADGLALKEDAGIVVSPDNKHVYTTGYSSDSVSAFSRDQTTGVLTQLSGTNACITHAALSGCVTGKALDAPWDIAISPDGKHVYVASYNSGAVSAFSRDSTTGALTQLTGTNEACISNAAISGCTTGRALAGADGVVVSPDGAYVYVASYTSNAVAAFSRNSTTGALTQLTLTSACYAETPGTGSNTTGCADGKAFTGALLLRMSPDGATLYVVSDVSDAVAVFSRNTSTGVLTQLTGTSACYAEAPGTPVSSTGCADGVGLTNAYDVVVSPDGNHVYTAGAISSTNGAVAAFTRDTSTGALTQLTGTAGCTSELVTGATASCADGVALMGPQALTISPGGQDVYVASFYSDAVAIFQRNATTGALTQVAGTGGCTSETGTAGLCVDGKGLDGPHRVLVAPDGKDVYSAGSSSSTYGWVGAFNRNR